MREAFAGAVLWKRAGGNPEFREIKEPWVYAAPAHAGCWGLARSARQESPAALLSCLDVTASNASANLLLSAARSALNGGQHSEPDMSVKDGVRRVPRLAPAAQGAGRGGRHP